MAYRPPQSIGGRLPKQYGGRISHIADRKKTKPKIFFLVGPTAVGKSEIAVYLAKKINAEIISCDSMQVYRRMNILTCKPNPKLRKQVPHHLLDIVSAQKEYNVSLYRKQAQKVIRKVFRRKKILLFVGGTGLYVTVLIDGIFEGKTENKKIRQRLYRQAEKSGSGYLYGRLKKVDPQAAAKIHPHDTRRMVRALEVFATSGKPISELQRQRKGLIDEYGVKIIGLNMPRELLYQRIKKRIAEMFRRGLVKEVRCLLKLKLSQTASSAIGIQELKGYFEGRYDLKEARRLLERNTCLYAKRQMTWFKKDKRIEWVQLRGREKAARVAERIWNAYF